MIEGSGLLILINGLSIRFFKFVFHTFEVSICSLFFDILHVVLSFSLEWGFFIISIVHRAHKRKLVLVNSRNFSMLSCSLFK